MAESRDKYSGNIRRQQAVGMDVLVNDFIRSMKLSSGLNNQRIFAAWDTVSGAAMYTVSRFVKGRTLYCSISSSMIRSQISFQKDSILAKINEFLLADELYTPIYDKDGNTIAPLENIILR